MNPNLVLLIPFLTTVAILLFAPLLTSRHSFFGIPVDAGFRSTERAKRALHRYQIWVAAAAAAGFVWILLRPQQFAAVVFPPVLLSVVTIATAAWNHRALRQFAVSAPTAAQVELSTDPDRLPRLFLLCIIPLAMLGATALYLHLHWAEIPSRYPVHWGINGQPNRWAIRSVRGVYGPLIFAAMWMAWFIAMALACWFYSRRSPLRLAMMKVMIAVEFLFAIIWPCVAFLPLHNFKGPATILVIIGGSIALVVYCNAVFKKAGSDGTPSFSGVHSAYNRKDASLLVPRADGFGYTPNLAHPAAWILTAAPFAIVFVGLKFIF